jgi:hypothetical protein
VRAEGGILRQIIHARFAHFDIGMAFEIVHPDDLKTVLMVVPRTKGRGARDFVSLAFSEAKSILPVRSAAMDLRLL